MTFDWKVKKINIQRYYKAVRRCIMLNGDDGTPLSGYRAWKRFKETWTVIVAPLSETEKYKHMFKHLKVEGSGGMAWGVTGKNTLWWFVADSRNPRIFMQNLGPGFHELLHALYQQEVGTQHITYLTRGNPLGTLNMKGKSGPASTVVVHDEWYGFKTSIRLWFNHGGWLPMRMPYIPIKIGRKRYNL